MNDGQPLPGKLICDNNRDEDGPVKVLFLHGIGTFDDDFTTTWSDSLNNALTVLDYQTISADQVIAPRYADLLTQGPKCEIPLPPSTVGKPAGFDVELERWSYFRRHANLEQLLAVCGMDCDNSKVNVPEITLKVIPEARRYVERESLRAGVLHTVLRQLPRTGEIVIIGHSLGSLVAIDLLGHLPAELIVRRLITIGSPAGHVMMHGNGKRLLKTFPVWQVRSWVNVWSTGDHVSFGRGIAQLFKYALDVHINLGPIQHGAVQYLAHRTVATTIGDAVCGSRSREIATISTAIEVPWDECDKRIVALLTYGHFLADEIKKDVEQQRRFRAALADVQQRLIDAICDYYRSCRRSVPHHLAILADGRRPVECAALCSVRNVVQTLIGLVFANPIQPYEIDVSQKARKRSLERLAQFLESPEKHGTIAFEAVKKARSVVTPGSWSKSNVALAAVGLATFAAAPIGLFLVAPAAAYGAAAITGALAAFGPGGMVGGLLTAGALATAGSGLTVAAAVSASPKEVERLVVQFLAYAIALKELAEPPDSIPWMQLCDLETKISHQIQRVETYSDKSSATLRDLIRKADAVRRAIEYLVDNGHVPVLGYVKQVLSADGD